MHRHHAIDLDHLDRMTDSTGLIQHAIYGIPRRESGYTTDDNARALRLCVRLWCHHADEEMLSRITKYLSFLEYAGCSAYGFHNFMSYERSWLDAGGTGDCQGQALRALAEVLGSALPDDHRMLARELIEQALPALADLRSLRAQAYVILAWGHLCTKGVKNVDSLENVAWFAAQRLVECFRRSLRPNWPWFELSLTYANAVLPHALFVAARRWPSETFLDVAKTSFAFLDAVTTIDNAFWPIGNNGWYPHGEDRALYDQQPVEAATMADAALAGFALLDDQKYLAAFCRAHDWFHGQNSSKRPLINAQRGTCLDGIQPSCLNRNQGAESMLAYLTTELQNSEIKHSLLRDHKAFVASA